MDRYMGMVYWTGNSLLKSQNSNCTESAATERLHLKEKEDGPLFKFYEVIMDVGGEFMQTVNTLKDLTLFAPSNEAWNDPVVQNIIR